MVLDDALQALQQVAQAYEAWQKFKQYLNLVFNSEEEQQRAFRIFEDNHEYIKKHNQEFKLGRVSFEVAHNPFSHLDPREFARLFKGFDAQGQRAAMAAAAGVGSGWSLSGLQNSQASAAVDWRAKGAVNPVQNQGKCGSCYAFAAVATIEAQHFIKTGKLVKLSEQNAMDCSTKFGNHGGNGGTMNNVFKSVIANGGINSAQSYPYEEKAGSCRYNPANSVTSIAGYVDIPRGDENALTKSVALVGPVAVGIDASRRSFQLYKSGIYNDPECSQNIDHAVVVVGYGSENGKDYYILRNSWGAEWGDQGYVKWPRNKNNFGGITQMASYPAIGGTPINQSGIANQNYHQIASPYDSNMYNNNYNPAGFNSFPTSSTHSYMNHGQPQFGNHSFGPNQNMVNYNAYGSRGNSSSSSRLNPSEWHRAMNQMLDDFLSKHRHGVPAANTGGGHRNDYSKYTGSF